MNTTISVNPTFDYQVFIDSNEGRTMDGASETIEFVHKILTSFENSNSHKNTKTLAARVTKDSSGEEVAYMYATAGQESFSLDLLFVKTPKMRIGSYLCQLAINTAKRWGAKKMDVCTFDFQAPKFYEEKFNFQSMAVLENALEGHALIFLERELEHETPEMTAELGQGLHVDILENEYSDPLDLFSEQNKKLKEIYDLAGEHLGAYNARHLESEDGLKRDILPFAVTVMDTEDANIVAAAIGLIILGAPNGSIVPELIGYKSEEYRRNGDVRKNLHDAMIEMGRCGNCSKITPYTPAVQEELEQLNFNSNDPLSLLKIIKSV
jgi:hypothetical protein